MKKINILILSIFLVTTLACEDLAEAVMPTACLKTEILQENSSVYIESTQAKVGQELFFSSCGESDYAVIFTGDENHVLPTSESDVTNSGFPMTAERFSYTYSEAGTYTVSLLVSNVSTYNTSKDMDIKRASTSVTITVTE
ncbi:hypothetical protein [uncultured Draconibacterium sp.]|uniref:hypothetical protein n=1 Tax=uncultured Draconibacterium sp. TaxID=1573823 RepID=UPI003260E010